MPTPEIPVDSSRIARDIFTYLERNEVGDAELFAELFHHKFTYDHADNKWYQWDANYWREDKTKNAWHAIDRIAATYEDHAKSDKSRTPEERNLLIARSKALHGRQRMKNVLELATTLPTIALSGDEWSVPPMSLPVVNGILDLQTGALRKGNPEEHINVFAPTEWLGLDHPAPSWERYVSDLCSDDQELIVFLQRLLGYGITGNIGEQLMPIFCGTGSNGKSTLLDTLRSVLGKEFCFPTQADSLMATRMSIGDGPRPFVCALRNKRLVWASESQEGQLLNTGLVKQLTGDQNITARNLYRKPITFTPSHKIFLVTNSLPKLPDGSDFAMHRRLVVFPFEASFVDRPTLQHERKLDKAIAAKLREEAPGILAWLLRGTISWLEQGLNPPGKCRSATDSYRADEDSLGQFAKSCVQIDQAQEVSAHRLYEEYFAWCNENGYDPKSVKSFGQGMTRRYSPAVPKWMDGKTCKVYCGISLVSSRP